MSFGDKIKVIQSNSRKVKLFVDFWNITISARNVCKDFDIDLRWDVLAEQLVAETRQGYLDESTGELGGCYIFGSVSGSNSKEAKYIERVLNRYGDKPGLYFDFRERVPKTTAIKCDSCNQRIKTRSESGVDVLLTVEMIKHANMRDHTYLGLVSSDRDFVPLLSYLRDQGHRVVHAATSKPDLEIRSLSWMQIDLSKRYTNLCNFYHDGYLVLTCPHMSAETEAFLSFCSSIKAPVRVIDITEPDQICDKDLSFIMENLNIYFSWSGGNENTSYSHKSNDWTMGEFRKKMRDGELFGKLPYVIKSGASVISYTGGSEHPWTQYMSPRSADAKIREFLSHHVSRMPSSKRRRMKT